MTPVPTTARSDEVPVLDLTPLLNGDPIEVLARELDRACRETGFFYVRNHGISELVLNAVSGRERYSIPMFFHLDYTAPVACLPICCSETNPPRYEPVAYGDYLLDRFRAVQKFRPEDASAA